MKKTIYLVPQGGLCNRMRVINSAQYIAERINSRVVVFWIGDDIGCEARKLFKKINNVTILEKCRWKYFRIVKKVYNKLLFIFQSNCEKKADAVFTDKEVEILRHNSEQYAIESIKNYNTVFISTCADLIMLKSCKLFSPSDEIQIKLDYEKKILAWSDDIIGIHIRRTDNTVSIEQSPSCLFMEKIDTEINNNPEARFYLATDSQEEEKTFKEKYGDRILTMQDKTMSRFDEQGQKDAYVELLLLSSCKEIWGSYWSSYSEMAAHISGIPLTKIKKN